MVELNKRIIEINIEIIFLIIMIILSYIIWDNFIIKESGQLAYAYYQNNKVLSMSKSTRSQDKENKTFIKIENKAEVSKEYNVLLSVDVEEGNKFKNSFVTISAEEISLKEVENISDKHNVYYKIITDNINSGEVKSYFISLSIPIEYDLELEEIE